MVIHWTLMIISYSSDINDHFNNVKHCTLYYYKVHICSGHWKDNDWGGDYWLALCLKVKQTINISLTNNEENHFLIWSMVVKSEYLTQENNIRKNSNYVFKDYKLRARDLCLRITNQVQVYTLN